MTASLDDYTVDSRGDVGSWVRMAACESLVPTFRHTSQVNIRGIIGKLLRLSVEKMDRVRNVSGRTLCTLVPLWAEAESDLRSFIEAYFPSMY